MKEIRLLTKDEIDVKVKQVTAKGAVLLLYKNARTDMNILDETFGRENWTNDYRDIDGVLFCGIGIRDDESKPFVWKWSNGIESRKDEDGNEVKGEASDAFKRAGFMVGIGRELYSSPFLFISAETEPDGKKYKLKDKYAKYKVDEIEYNGDRTIKNVVISDQNGNIVFGANRAYKKPTTAKQTKEEDYSTVPEKPKATPKTDDIDESVIADIEYLLDKMGDKKETARGWIKTHFKKEVQDLTLTEANYVIKVLSERVSKQGK